MIIAYGCWSGCFWPVVSVISESTILSSIFRIYNSILVAPLSGNVTTVSEIIVFFQLGFYFT